MLIGIDASRSVALRPAQGGAQRRTGTENYSFNLIRHLLALGGDHRYRLYFNRPPSCDLRLTNCDLRVMPFPRLWTHARLSWEMARRPPDLLFVPAHVLPIVHPRRSVVTIHDLGYLYYPEAHRLLDRLYLDLSTRYNARAATHLIADSSATKRDLIERYGTKPDKITVIYPGYDQTTFHPVRDKETIEAVKAKFDIAGDYILFVGTLQPRKNLTRLIEAFSNLQYPISNIQLLIAGKKGWLYQDIFQRVEELGLQGKVIFTGYVPEGDLPALLSGASLFVFPSLYEGFGLPVLEAMACATPVVCSNASSLPEVAGDAALLVDPLDVEGLAAAMERVLCDEELRAELIERGFEQARKFSWEKCARETLDVLEVVGWSDGRMVKWSDGRMVEWSNSLLVLRSTRPPDHLTKDHLTKDHLTKDHLTILVVKLSDIGDVLTATPALRALRESFPAAYIEALVPPNSAPALAGSPLVDDVIVFDKFQYDRPVDALKPSSLAALVRLARHLRRQRYDCIVILHHLTTRWGTLKYAALALTSGAKVRVGLDNGRGWFLTHRARDGGFGARHEVEYWLDVVGTIGAVTEDTSLEITIGPEDEAFADGQISPPCQGGAGGGCPVVAIHPGSGGYSLARRWSAEGFARVADALVERYGARIVLVGTPADGVSQVASLMRSEAVNLEGRTNLKQLAAVLKRCDLFVGADSGVMHLAAAMGTPLVAIFGPSNHRAWGPWPRDGRHIILRADLPCSPCSYVGYSVGQREGCQAMTCMKAITPEIVLAAAESLLQGNTNFQYPIPNIQYPISTILGVRTDNVNYDQALSLIESFIESGEPHQVVTVNPEFIVAAQSDDDFRDTLNSSSLSLPDGVGLLWAARFLGHPLQERVTGTDTVQRVAGLAAQKGYSLFLLGAAPGVAVETAARLCQTYPGLRIVGTHAGSPAPEEEDEIVRMIQKAKPDVLFVAYGAPAQDKWIARNLERLGVPAAMGVGGAFDFISGRAKRAPPWLQRLGLEWLHRLACEPWRWRRMLALPKFVWLVMWERLAKG